MRIGIILTGDYSWAGGVYYSLNIIRLLQKISLAKPLTVVVFVNKYTQQELLAELRHKNIEVVDLDDKSFFYKLWCKFMGYLSKGNYRFVQDMNSAKLDLLYPVIHYEKIHARLNCKVLYWLFDFQHKFLPDLFSKEELDKRDRNFEQVTEHALDLVVSSYDSKNHLLQFYPQCKANIHVYNFVSLIHVTDVKSKLIIPDNYLVVCNQFWPHKNHLTVLKAIAFLVSQKKNIHVVFTGKFDQSPYVKELQNYIAGNRLQDHLTFTGFIAREEQVELIRKAKAVVQPSLFEGWSTVIEDAKALNKLLIVSDLAIHHEQLKQDVHFFRSDDHETLSTLMLDAYSSSMVYAALNYQQNIERSTYDLQTLFNIL